MPVFDHMPMGEEGLKEIYSWVDNFVRDNGKIADKMVLGKSEDGQWEVPAVVVTNKSVSDDQKQIAIVTLARHGQERGTRVVGPEILHYLASDDAGEIRDKQTVIVVPIVNPIGVVLDKFHSSLHGITDHEKVIFGNLCSSYTPDMMIDYHSIGKLEPTKYDRGDAEIIITANSTNWGMDDQIYQYVATKMMEAAAAKGWPYEIHTLEDLSYYYFVDFRISIRPSGKNPGERRISREKLWKERFNFDVLKREMLEDPEATLVEVGYLGKNVPLDFDLYLRMRQDVIKEVLVEERKSKFETFKDDCSTFISIPISIKNAGKLKLKIIHEPYRRNG